MTLEGSVCSVVGVRLLILSVYVRLITPLSAGHLQSNPAQWLQWFNTALEVVNRTLVENENEDEDEERGIKAWIGSVRESFGGDHGSQNYVDLIRNAYESGQSL